MTATPEYYEPVLEDAPLDAESVTYVVITDATVELVAAALGVDLSRPVDPADTDDIDTCAYALAAIPGGVVAMENTGYGDPSREALVRLSGDGRTAAVARSNIQGHYRFGCARDGELVFDDDEYIYLEPDDRGRVPADLRPLFDQAWVDLDSDDESETDPLAVALAMAETLTGLAITGDDLRRAEAGGFFRAPSLTYQQ